VVDGVTGVLVHDEAGLVAAVDELLSDPERRTRLGLAARERAATFGWDEAVDAFEKALVAAYSP
jgi:glycosyltransferase involved in cell wall biosynthesis